MEKFELCFEFPDIKKQYLIPDLLPKRQPESLDIEKYKKGLAFELHYDVLPGSVISRFIVRSHHSIYNKTYWRTGVVLKQDNNRVLVKADLEDKKIFIWVVDNPNGRRGLLSTIRNQFAAIHQTIAKLIVTEKVPYKNVTIDYQHLLNLEEANLSNFMPPGLKEIVNVQELLGSIRIQRGLQPAGHQSIEIHGNVDKLIAGEGSYDMRDINISGGSFENTPIGDNNGNISYQIQNIQNVENPELKKLLSKLQTLIEQAEELQAQSKTDALQNIDKLAQVANSPGMFGAKGALANLEELVQATIVSALGGEINQILQRLGQHF